MSQEIADGFVEALRKLEEDRDVEALVRDPRRGLRGGQRLGPGYL